LAKSARGLRASFYYRQEITVFLVAAGGAFVQKK
jgi:hypothetical protein